MPILRGAHPGRTAGLRPETLTAPLLSWYQSVKRDLPWRRDPRPWPVWVCEIMCQQTRVESVIPYFERFMNRFESPSALAEAPVEELLDLWAGLGYYRRARNLHLAATQVVELHGGLVPDSPEVFRTLAGVGAYTCGAVQSIAFGHRVPVVDGNVERVLCRLNSYTADPRTAAGKRWVWARAAQLADHEVPGEINQALMELGATVCTPKGPDCDRCPLAGPCSGRTRPTLTDIPYKKPRKTRPTTHLVCAVVTDEAGCVYLRRRPSEAGLLAGLWELPSIEGTEAGALEAFGLAVSATPDATIRHGFTHRVWVLDVHHAQLIADAPQPDWHAFTTEQMAASALCGPALKALRALNFDLPHRRGAG